MGYLLAAVATFFWSFNLIIASYFSSSLMPFEIAFGRWLVASCILIPWAWKGIKANFNLLKNNWKLIFWLAITGIVLDNTLIYYAGRTASSINMGLLDITGPIFLVILSCLFFKTKISMRQILGIAVAVFGVVTVIIRGDFSQLGKISLAGGDFIMLANTFCFAVYSLLQAKRPAEISQRTMLSVTVFVGTVIIFPFMLWDTGWARLLSISGSQLAVLFYLGVCNSVISYLAWNTALAKIGSVKTGIIYYLLPIFTGIEAYFILGEKIYMSQIYGGLLVIGGIALVSLKLKKKKLKRRSDSQ